VAVAVGVGVNVAVAVAVGANVAVAVAAAVGVGLAVGVAVGVPVGVGAAVRAISTLFESTKPSNPATTIRRFPIAVPLVRECGTFVDGPIVQLSATVS
jgi:hypothetical protein